MANGAVILDVDGTLVDSNDAHAHAWVDAFAADGIAVSFESVRRAIGMGGDKLMPHVAGIEEDSEPGTRISERRGRIFRREYLPHVRAFPDVRALLQRLRDDELTLAVASSATKDELNALLEIADVVDLVDAKASSDEADRSKPEPDIVHAALQRARSPKDRTIMLGDTPYDVEAAARAGIEIVGLECGGWTRDELRGAVEGFESPAHLLRTYERSVFQRIRSLLGRTS